MYCFITIMHYEIKEPSLNGHFKVFSGFRKSHHPMTIRCYTFIWNQGESKQWEIDLIPLEVPSNTIFSFNGWVIDRVCGIL